MQLFLDRDTLVRGINDRRTWLADIRLDDGDLARILIVVSEAIFTPLVRRDVPEMLSRSAVQDRIEQAARRALLRPHAGGELVLTKSDFD